MFKANDQPQLFSFENELGKKLRKALDGSKEKWFYHLISMAAMEASTMTRSLKNWG